MIKPEKHLTLDDATSRVCSDCGRWVEELSDSRGSMNFEWGTRGRIFIPLPKSKYPEVAAPMLGFVPHICSPDRDAPLRYQVWRSAAMAVCETSWCGAQIGKPCVGRGTGVACSWPHNHRAAWGTYANRYAFIPPSVEPIPITNGLRIVREPRVLK